MKKSPFSLHGTIAVAALYGVVNALVRLTAGTRLAMDDAKTNLFTQAWQWGYQADNPPLYEWLISLLHLVTGGGLLSFLILKYLCLTAAAAFTHLTVRRLLPDAETRERESVAFAAAMGLVLLYQIGWNFHQAFTHSALLVAASAAGLYLGLRLVQARRLSDYILFGVVLGVGMLAKYNFALLAIPFLAAAALTRETRRAVLTPRLLLSLAIAGLIVFPHALWLLDRSSAYQATLDATLGLQGSRLERLGNGAVSLIVATISFFLPYGFIVLGVKRGARQGLFPSGPATRLLLLTAALSLGMLFLGVLFFGIGDVSERYVIPSLLPAYTAYTARLLAAFPRGRRGWLIACLATAAAFTLLRLVAFAVAAPPFCSKCGRFIPYETLTDTLKEVTPEGSVYIALEENTAGNLVAAFPAAKVRSFNLIPFMNPTDRTERPCYLVWSEDMVAGIPLPGLFAFSYDDPHTVMVDAPWRHPLKEEGYRRTVWGITPLNGRLYDRFCVPGSLG